MAEVTGAQKRRDSLGSWEASGGIILGEGKRGLRSMRRVGSYVGGRWLGGMLRSCGKGDGWYL